MTSRSIPVKAQPDAAVTQSGALPNRRIGRLTWFVMALVLALSFAFPIYVMVSSSFKAETEVLTTPIHWWPQEFQGLTQYRRAFDVVPLLRFFFNSLLMASIDVVVTVIFSAMAGY